MKLIKHKEFQFIQKIAISPEEWNDILNIVSELAHPHPRGRVDGAVLKIIMEGNGEIELPITVNPNIQKIDK